MPRIQPLLPLFSPLVAPRRAACEQLFRFSTATRLRVQQPPATTVDAASSIQKPPKAPTSSPELASSPQEGSRAGNLAGADASADLKIVKPKTLKTTKKTKKPNSAHDVQPAGDALDAAINLKTVKPKTFSAPTKAKISSRADPNATQKLTLELPPPKYHVARSATKNLPIYTDFKRGGNLHLTTIRKITGDLSALRDELRVFLNKKNEDVKINSLTQHVIIKGHHVPQVTEFLNARGM